MNLRSTAAFGAALFLSAALMPAQQKRLDCNSRDSGNNNRVCEMREQSLPYSGRLEVDASPNGGISITAWDQGTVLIRSKIEAWGDNEMEAKDRLSQVRIIAAGTTVKSDGPKSSNWNNKGDLKWSVSYEIFTPAKSDLVLESVNGGININGIRGNLKFETVNGGVHLTAVNGTVKGETVNGGVDIDIAGTRWEGDGMQVQTVNGGVTISVPASFSANVHAETVNGGMSSDFEGAQISGKWGPKKMDLNVGGGGPTVKVETVNGGVKVRRKG